MENLNVKSVIVSVVVSLLALVVGGFAIVGEVKEQLAVSRAEQAAVPEALGGPGGAFSVLARGAGSLPDGIELGDGYVNFHAAGTIGSGVNTASWKNKTGRKVVIDYAEMRTTGTASTTFDFFVSTSSAATISTFDFGAANFSELIDGKRVATSSAILVVNSIKDAGTNGRSAIEVEDGEFVFLGFRQSFATNSCNGAWCESATSTNRGFNVRWVLHGHYLP